MRISSADLLGTAALAARYATATIEGVRNDAPIDPVSRLNVAEDKLIAALAEVRAARWGIERRLPQFDDVDLDIILAEESRQIRTAAGLIPLVVNR